MKGVNELALGRILTHLTFIPHGQGLKRMQASEMIQGLLAMN